MLAITSRIAYNKHFRLIFDAARAFALSDNWMLDRKCDVLLIGSDAHFNYKIGNKWYSPLLGSMKMIIEDSGNSTCTLVKPYSTISRHHSWDEHITFNRYQAITLVYRAAGRLLSRFRDAANHRDGELWRIIINKTKPSKIIAIMPTPTLCSAARSAGIQIWDLQHGVINDQHRWYGSAYRAATPIEELPTGFMVWDEAAAETLRKWASAKNIDIKIIGHPWLQRFLNQKEGDLIVSGAAATSPSFTKTNPTILFTLQWGMERISPCVDFDGILFEGLKDVIHKTADKYNWMLRLHPIQLHGKSRNKIFKYLRKTFVNLPSVEWEKSSIAALPAILAMTDLHITYNSSVVIEASYFGIKSAILDTSISTHGNKNKYYNNERSSGAVTLIGRRCVDINTWIEHSLSTIKAGPASNIDYRGHHAGIHT